LVGAGLGTERKTEKQDKVGGDIVHRWFMQPNSDPGVKRKGQGHRVIRG